MKKIIKPLIVDLFERKNTSKQVLAEKVRNLSCPVTVVWTNGNSLSDALAFLACAEDGKVSVLAMRYENWSEYRTSQMINSSATWSGTLKELEKGILAQDESNGFRALIVFVRSHRVEIVPFNMDVILNTRGFANLADLLVGRPA